MKAHRLERMAEVIREVAGETILFELRDPRVRNAAVTVTRAEVSGDLQHAKIYVSIMGSQQEQEQCLSGLQRSSGFIQSKLGDRLKTRYTPLVRFVLDQGVKKSIEITRLINEALGQSRLQEGAEAVEISSEEESPDEEDTPEKETDNPEEAQ